MVVGDGAVGKTSLLAHFTIGHAPSHYLPAVFEHYAVDVRIDRRAMQLQIQDTAAQPGYNQKRCLSYVGSDVVLVAFSIDRPESLVHARHNWSLEAREMNPGVPIILIGLKKDLRDNPGSIEDMRSKGLTYATAAEGWETAKGCGANCYLECSNLTGEGVDDVFEVAARATLPSSDKKPNTNKFCAIL